MQKKHGWRFDLYFCNGYMCWLKALYTYFCNGYMCWLNAFYTYFEVTFNQKKLQYVCNQYKLEFDPSSDNANNLIKSWAF